MFRIFASRLLPSIVCLTAGLQASLCSAVLVTFTATARPGDSPDASDGMGAVDVWNASTSTGDGSQAGNFQGDSGANGDGNGAGAGTSAWALYANSGQSSSAAADISVLAGRDLNLVGDSISLDFDNGYIDTGGVVGIRFKDPFGADVSTFRFTGGESSYQIDDATAGFDTAIGFSDDGFNVELTLDSPTGDYTLQVGSSTFSGRTLASAATTIAAIEVFNFNAGPDAERNVFFDTLSISAVPELSPAITLPLLLGAAWGLRSLRRRL